LVIGGETTKAFPLERLLILRRGEALPMVL
jgi:hypothetical protein